MRFNSVVRQPFKGTLTNPRPLNESISHVYAQQGLRKKRQQYSVSTTTYAASTSSLQGNPADNNERPRWSYTPERLKMPVRVRLADPKKEWECNSNPKRLDRFYISFLGPGGDKMLSEEVKWLAITHKSFEQGARGFNDRLAFLGRRILNFQTNLTLLSLPVAHPSESSTGISIKNDRVPFTHPALDGLANLFHPPLTEILSRERIASFATSIGMRQIVRWHPRMTHDLDASGIETVLVTSTYAIVGALALENGGDVASEIARSKILKHLNIR